MDATPFWAESKLPEFPPLDRSMEADVVVIGGGLTGISAANTSVRGPRQASVACAVSQGNGSGAISRGRDQDARSEGVRVDTRKRS